LNVAVLIYFAAFAARYCILNSLQPHIWLTYVFPSFLIIIGFLLNIFRSVDFESFGYFGSLIPWFAFLSVPFLIRDSGLDMWRYYYYFMLFATVIGLLEQGLIFYGLLIPTQIDTDLGPFSKGVLTIFHQGMVDGISDRLYSIFAEPGTYAMFLLPAIVYALVVRKYSALFLFGVALYLTASLGGYIGVVVIILIYLFRLLIKFKFPLATSILITIVVAFITSLFLLEPLSEMYSHKREGSIIAFELSGWRTREDIVIESARRMTELIMEYPIGYELAGGGKSLSAIEDPNYLGSNFAFYSALVFGGGLSLLGYVIVTMVTFYCTLASLVKRNLDIVQTCAFVSFPALLLFCFQREVVMDTPVFAFLFGPSLLRFIRKGGVRQVNDHRHRR
jgi:hypothetical protein